LYSVLDAKQLDEIHLATLYVLERTGVMVYDDDVLLLLRSAGCGVDQKSKVAKFPKKKSSTTLSKGRLTASSLAAETRNTIC
jgi:trimethylamine:corrinoid methyltransferase-like protein